MGGLAMPTRSIFLKEVEVICSIGINEAERVQKQRVLIDVELRLDSSLEYMADDISEVLNYDEVKNRLTAIALERHHNLQETLGQRIFDALASLPQVTGVSVMTQKPDAYQDCAAAAFRISNID